MVGFTGAMNDLGVATMRFNFPYMEAGRRSPDNPASAVAAWRAAIEAAGSRRRALPCWRAASRSAAGSRSIAVAEGMPAAALVFLGYPLHPPGKPERIRDEHLYGIRVPMLFLQGTARSLRDARTSWGRWSTKLAAAPRCSRSKAATIRSTCGARKRDRPRGRCLAGSGRRAVRPERRADAAQEPARTPSSSRRRRRLRARADAPLWAQVPGFDVRQVGGQKEYRCPGLRPHVPRGVWHLVVVPRRRS